MSYELSLVHYELMFGQLGGAFRDHSRIIPGSFRDHSGVIPASFRGHSRVCCVDSAPVRLGDQVRPGGGGGGPGGV